MTVRKLALRTTALLVVIIAITAFIVTRFAGTRQLLSTLAGGNWYALGAAVGLHLVVFAVTAFLYQVGFAAVGVESRLWTLLPVVFASRFVNAIAPVGGAAAAVVFVHDAVRRGQSGARTMVGTLLVLIANLATTVPLVGAGLGLLYVNQQLLVMNSTAMVAIRWESEYVEEQGSDTPAAVAWVSIHKCHSEQDRLGQRELTMISSYTGNHSHDFPQDTSAVQETARTPDPGQLLIRQYRLSDRLAIRRLCCQTGFLGEPIDPIFCDRELFADLFTKAYLDYEKERVLVAEMDGLVIGYLLGSVRLNFEWLLLYAGLQTTCKMLFRLGSGRYRHHPRSKRFIRWLLTMGFREQPQHPRGAAHLHFNVDKPHRGRGIARRLWEAFEQMLLELQIGQCYGAFVSYPARRPEFVYARYGFTVYHRKQTTLFQPEIADPVEVVCAHKQLSPPVPAALTS